MESTFCSVTQTPFETNSESLTFHVHCLLGRGGGYELYLFWWHTQEGELCTELLNV